MSAKIKHTPGPWEVCGLTIYQCDDWEEGENRGRRKIGVAFDPDWDELDEPTGLERPEREANAYLIAASPELLRLCRECLVAFRELGVMPEFRKELALAISKTENPHA